MSGPAPKPADQRQRRNKRDVGVLVPIEAAQMVPKPPDGLLAITKAAWESFWCSPTSALVVDSDLPALHRLFGLYDELDRIWRAARKLRLTEGHTGQPVLHPLYKEADVLRAAIVVLEDRFGLTPMARLKLGVKFGQAKSSLANDIDGEPDADSHQDEVDAIDA